MSIDIRRIGVPFFALLLTIGIAACGDNATGVEPTENIFPSEKLELSDTDLPELDFYAGEFGFELETSVGPNRGDRTSGNRGDNADGDPNRPGRPNADPLQRLVRILGALDLNERQSIAIRGCFEEYRECRESATKRARAVRQELHDELVAKLRRIRNAVQDGTITPERARELYRECISEYRGKVRRLIAAYHAALRDCYQNLIKCISGYLTDAQLEKFRELLGKGHDGDRDGNGDRDKDGRDKDGRDKDGRDKDGRDGDGDDTDDSNGG